MQNVAIQTFIIAIFSFFVNFSWASTQDCELNIEIAGFKSDRGNVKIGLANSKENYKSKNNTFRSSETVIKGKQSRCIFKNLPLGEYAVRIYHDENANGKLDFNLFGIPKESYGFSNNVRGLFGPPAFKKAKFTLSENRMTIKIKVR